MSFIRSALGAPPRRLSHVFLHSERCSLHAHRVRCRSFYEQRIQQEHLPHPEGVPVQCRVGQTVTARHPKLRTIHDGDVLTAGVNTYMVQFHRADLGVAKVPDTDVALAQAHAPSSGAAASVGAADGTSSRGGAAQASGAKVCSFHLHQRLLKIGMLLGFCAVMHCLSWLAACASLDTWRGRVQTRETEAADLDLMARVTQLLTDKEKVLAELRSMTTEAQRRRDNGEVEQFDEEFQNAFAIKVLAVRCSPVRLHGAHQRRWCLT